MQIISNFNNVNLGLKNDSKTTRKVLENVEPNLRKDIIEGLNAFCDITQKCGIKGSVMLKSLDSDVLTYTIKPVKTGEVKKLSIDVSEKPWHSVPHRELIKRSFLDSIDYLFK